MNSENDKRILNQFCKFCTRLLKNEICDVYREQNRGQKYKKAITIFPLDDIGEIGTYDNYFKNENTFYINGKVIIITDNRLAKAIRQLPKNKQEVIILSYFLGMSDIEIGRRLNLIQQTVFKRRKQALKLLSNLLQKEDFQYEQKEN